MRAHHLAVYAQSADIPWNQGRFIVVLTAILTLIVMFVGIGIVGKARKQSTSDALEVGTRVIIGVVVAASATGILAIGAMILHWTGLTPS